MVLGRSESRKTRMNTYLLKAYLLSLIAACGAISKRGKLVCVTVKVDIALYVFGIKSVAAHYTLIAVTLW